MSGEDKLQKALEDLNSAYLAVRIAAIQKLTDSRHLPALPQLMSIVRDTSRDERTRAMAVRALGKLGDAAAVPALVEALREVPPEIGEDTSTEAVPGTVSLKGVLLSANIPAALRALGTREALDALERWSRGELAQEDTARARAEKRQELVEKVRAQQGIDQRVRVLMEAVNQIISAERSVFALKNPATNAYDLYREARGLDPRKIDQSNVTTIIIDQAAADGKPILTTNAQADSRFAEQQSIVTVALRSIMAVPFKVGDQVIGVAYGDNRLRSGLIKAEDFMLLAEFAALVGPLLAEDTPPVITEAASVDAAPEPKPAAPDDWFGGSEYAFSDKSASLKDDVEFTEVIPRAEAPTPRLRRDSSITGETDATEVMPTTPWVPRQSPTAPPQPAAAPAPSRAPDLPRSQASPASGPVQVGAYSPKTVILDDWQPLYAYVFREHAANIVVADAFEQLGRKQAGYSGIAKPGLTTLPEGAQITATPTLRGFQFNPVSVTIGFYEAWARFDFRLRAKDAPPNQFATGTITFTVDGIILADVPLSVYVGQAGGDAEINSAVSRIYQAIFCSYSHADTQIVERVERAYKALGLDYLRDVTTLKSGEHWSAEILELIDQADIFQLFWSPAAAQSPYVRQEWMHALRYDKARPSFIRPVWWKAPMPPVPPELSHIHFAFQPDLDQA